jgi:hypothetical protein
MVFVARGHIPRATFDTATEKGGRRLGTQTPNCENPRAVLKQTAYTKIEKRDCNNRMATTAGTEPNPPHRDGIPAKMDYIRRFAVHSAYVAERGHTESTKSYKQRMYDTLHYISRMETGPREMRIIRLWLNTDWATAWKNLAETPVVGEIKAAWYKVINDILPTKERLQKIRIAPTDKCRHCDRQDTLLDRLTECGEGEQIWKGTRQKLAVILRTIPGRIPSEWLLRPHLKIWPPTRRRTVQWIIANVVFLRTQIQRERSLQDTIDFLRRSKWKLYKKRHRRGCVANYLSVIDKEE